MPHRKRKKSLKIKDKSLVEKYNGLGQISIDKKAVQIYFAFDYQNPHRIKRNLFYLKITKTERLNNYIEKQAEIEKAKQELNAENQAYGDSYTCFAIQENQIMNNKIKLIMLQLLQALIFLDKNRIVHLNISPETIQVQHQCAQTRDEAFIVLLSNMNSCYYLDSAKHFSNNDKSHEYDTIRNLELPSSKFYRSPEVILNYNLFITSKTMVWNVGLILNYLAFDQKLPYQKSIRNNEAQILSCIEYFGGRFADKSQLTNCLYKFQKIVKRPINRIRFNRKLPLFWSSGQVKMPKVPSGLEGFEMYPDSFSGVINKCLRTNIEERGTLEEIHHLLESRSSGFLVKKI